MVQNTMSWKSEIWHVARKPNQHDGGETANLVLPRNPGTSEKDTG
jgi:hypothetical protein